MLNVIGGLRRGRELPWARQRKERTDDNHMNNVRAPIRLASRRRGKRVERRVGYNLGIQIMLRIPFKPWAVAGVLLTFTPFVQAADTVDAGWSLMKTDSAHWASYGLNFTGVPYVNFDFGGSIGSKYVGQTDTIIQRLNDVSVPGSTPIQIVGLQLKSTTTLDPDGPGPFPADYVYATLQSLRLPGEHGVAGTWYDNPQPSTGTAIIGTATFSDSFDVFGDVRYGSLTGPILDSFDIPFTAVDVPWSHTPIGNPLIPGVNVFLNGANSAADFFVQTVTHDTGGGHHEIIYSSPDGSLYGSGLVTLLGLLAYDHLRRKAASSHN